MALPCSHSASYGNIPCNDSVVLVSQDHPEVLVHELAHAFGQGEEYYTKIGYNDSLSPVNGYNPFAVNPANATGRGVCYQYPTGLGAPNPLDDNCTKAESIMGNSTDQSQVWIDELTYRLAFEWFLNPTPDPQILLVSGILASSGQFTFKSSYQIPNGTLNDSLPSGDVVVSALDQYGRQLSSVRFQSNFNAIATLAPGSTGSPNITLGAIPVVVSLPFDSNMTSISVSSNNGKILNQVSLKGQLLSGIISSIPNQAFKSRRHHKRDDRENDNDNAKPASQKQIQKYRIFLGHEVTQIQKILDSKHPKRAAALLKELIDRIEWITFDNYQVTNSMQYTQLQVIDGIESIIEGLD